MTAPLDWFDLRVEGDPHPRRFDSAASARAYLLRVERLSEEAAEELLIAGEVHPPLSRRSLELRPLRGG
ncbi:hypothetical protein CBQ26_05745 [Deinococcus indicus]|jgi:hypothetical protein|uniref:Uncharacterized protein n=2 Tax=Deinococcus TaxID=1298 RepID=A0A246BQ11_9DEIO|nr:hypothetical protein [Deinococcus indicus]OWL97751.1 hypothetical protein CBQ26_05745 [Deinococcus indicus]GHG17739.1 hypothetical protein GCM10017784_05900 [Deinococcus indicus]